MDLHCSPSRLAIAGVDLNVIAGQVEAAMAAAAAAITTIPPAGADEVSAAAVTAFGAHGTDFHTKTTDAHAELGRSGTTLTNFGSGYLAGDVTNAARLTAATRV